MRERVRVASVSVVWIGGLEFSKCDGLEDSFGLRCSIFAIKTNKSPNLAPGDKLCGEGNSTLNPCRSLQIPANPCTNYAC